MAKLIAVNFGFMYTMVGRMVFLLFVGFMSFSLKLFGQLAMAILYLVFCFHIFVYVKYPRSVQFSVTTMGLFHSTPYLAVLLDLFVR